MTSEQRVLVQQADKAGGMQWTRARLLADPIADVIELRYPRGLLSRKPPLTIRPDMVTSFDILPVDDPHAKLYVTPLVLAVVLVLGGSLRTEGWWEPLVDLGILLLDGALAAILVRWLKQPIIELGQAVPEEQTEPVLPLPVGVDARPVLRDRHVREAMAQRVKQMMSLGQAGSIRAFLKEVEADPAAALAAQSSRPSDQRILIAGRFFGGPAATRSAALRIADVLAAHRYRGLMPDLTSEDRWHVARRRGRIALALSILVLAAITIATLYFQFSRTPL